MCNNQPLTIQNQVSVSFGPKSNRATSVLVNQGTFRSKLPKLGIFRKRDIGLMIGSPIHLYPTEVLYVWKVLYEIELVKARHSNPEGKSAMNWPIIGESQLAHYWDWSLVRIPSFSTSLVWTLGSNPNLTCLVLYESQQCVVQVLRMLQAFVIGGHAWRYG